MARLVIFDDRMRGIDLPRREVIIGRSRRVDVPIQDELLSRKHCSIVPLPGGYRLFDLKSQNGTFLNGGRVNGSELEFDDIIEVGRTVLVFLDTETWGREEALAGLRNPSKAEELVQKINAGAREGVPAYPVTCLKSAGRGGAPESPAPFFQAIEAQLLAVFSGEPREAGPAVSLLENYVLYELSRRVVRSSPRLRQLTAALVSELAAELARGDAPADLATKIRELVSRKREEGREEGREEEERLAREPGSGPGQNGIEPDGSPREERG